MYCVAAQLSGVNYNLWKPGVSTTGRSRNCRDSVARRESGCESVCLLWREPRGGRSDGTHDYFEWEWTPRARWSSRFVVNFYVTASELIVLQSKVKSQGIWCWKFALCLLRREGKLWPRARLCAEMCKAWLIKASCSSEPCCDMKPSRRGSQNTAGNGEGGGGRCLHAHVPR